jgi:hypothetical protein
MIIIQSLTYFFLLLILLAWPIQWLKMLPYSKWMIILRLNWNPIGRTVRGETGNGEWRVPFTLRFLHSSKFTVGIAPSELNLSGESRGVFRSNLWAELDVVELDSLIFVVRIVPFAAFLTKLTRSCFHFSVVLWRILVSICVYFLIWNTGTLVRRVSCTIPWVMPEPRMNLEGEIKRLQWPSEEIQWGMLERT